MADLSVLFAGVPFKNPIVPASGAFGYGREYEPFYPLSKLGGISCKGMTLRPQDGNPPPRVAETPAGMLNSVGLQNPGIDAFLRDEVPNLAQKNTVIIANVAGHTIEDCVEIARRLEGSAVDMIELNISCPNVKEGGVAFGVNPQMAHDITKAVREASSKPLMVKLSPNVTSITDIAQAVEAAEQTPFPSSIPCLGCGLISIPAVQSCTTMSAGFPAPRYSRWRSGWSGRSQAP